MTVASIAKGILGVFSGKVGEKIVGVIDQFVTDKDLNAQLKHALNMQNLVGEQDLEKMALETERDIVLAQEATHQVTLQQSDTYTKRSRPKIARSSWRLAWVYMASYLGMKVFSSITFPDSWDITFTAFEFQWEIFVAISAPALQYIGVRGLEKWKNPGS